MGNSFRDGANNAKKRTKKMFVTGACVALAPRKLGRKEGKGLPEAEE